MQNKIGTITCVAVVLACASVAQAQQSPQSTPPPPKSAPSTAPSTGTMNAPTKAEVMDDVTKTFGFVPDFIKVMPDSVVVGFWVTMKTFEMNPNTKLDMKTKELIGLAVAAQIPCEYCVYFHTQAARRAGANDQEIKEAVGMAAVTRSGSTILNGMQLDRMQFRKDVDRVMKGEKGKAQASRTP